MEKVYSALMAADWQWRAECHDHIELFDRADQPRGRVISNHPEYANTAAKIEAHAICMRCEVLHQCLEDALNIDKFGLMRGYRAGTTTRMRRKILREKGVLSKHTNYPTPRRTA